MSAGGVPYLPVSYWFSNWFCFIFSCGLKEGNGVFWNFVFIFLPLSLVVILLFMLILYFLIWVKIYTEGKQIAATIGEQSVTSSRILVVTRNMSFFILVFILRFTLLAVHGLWVYIDEPPTALYHILSFVTCAGGIFNELIYLTVRRNHL
jgi:hypothetical protein